MKKNFKYYKQKLMKKAFYLTIFACGFLLQLHAQTITCPDYSKWPEPLRSDPKKKLDKSNPFVIEIDKIDTTNLNNLLKNSILTGILNGSNINKILSEYKDNSSFIKIDTSGNKATINVLNILAGIKEGDSVDLKLKKDGKDTGIAYSISSKAGQTSGNSNANNTSAQAAIPIIPQDELQKYFDDNYRSKIIKTDIGFKMKLSSDPKGKQENKDNEQAYYTIHIFLDQYGNTLFGSMPTGVQRRYHYVIHILYAEDQSKNYQYSISVTSGSLNDAISFYNSNVSPKNGQQGMKIGEPKTSTIQEVQYNLFPTSDDLSFDLNVITLKDDGTAKSSKLQSYTLKKSPFYFGSLNIGGVYTWVKNPSYQLVNSPVNPDKKTVKTTDNTSGVMGTLLYTVYWSPINAIFKSKDDFKYHSWGRSYLDDDGAFFRKIYPCFGFGLQDQVFTNIIVGLDYEPIQGFGLVVGQNIRKVNTFDMPNFIEGETDVTQDQFDFYQNTKWKTGWTVGLEIDLTVFNKIVGSITTSK
jgi:hypothetical protein